MFRRLHKLLLAISALAPMGLAVAMANPLGGQVVGGSATIQGQGTPTVTVTQQSNSAIVNWNTFNIGAGEKTNIVMPSASSVELDRVTGGLGPSQILGSLWSNGRVFLVNPDGILFGAGAKVDAAGFLATTNNIANADFMAGNYNFSIPGNPSASVVNLGTITAQSGGFAALVAPGVRNSGTITAKLGTVALASGNEFTLDFYGDKLITLGVNDAIAGSVTDVATGQPLSSLVSNQGKLKANGGTVELTAVAARQVIDSVINNTGVIEANTIGSRNGMIVLSAATAASKPAGAPAQTVKVSGKLSAAGKKKGATGGTVVVTGENIQVASAKIDATGRAGGGTVLIGGDTGGGNPSAAVADISQAQLQPYPVPTASNVTVDAATTINASAIDAGNGGKVVLWSDQSTSFNGTILARGGANSGNGGFVETSGHTLDFSGAHVNTSAPNGLTGLWLLDPYDLTIDGSAASTIATDLATTNVTIQTTASGSSGAGIANPSGNGDIFVDSNIAWNSTNSLTLSAYRDISVSANITNTDSAAVTLQADNTGTGVGTVSFSGGAQVSTAGPASIFYNPSVNPAGSVVNSASYVSPIENYSSDVTGGGTLTAYMLVNTIYDLQNIQNNLSGTYALGKDIDASGTASWNASAGFVPIGGAGVGNSFRGSFEGNNHTIDQLTINANASTDYLGLFGYIASGATVQNVNLTNVNITGGLDYIGGLVGENDGTVKSSSVGGTVSSVGCSCFVVGGIVGYNVGNITNSSSTAVVSGLREIGGLVGQSDGTITQSHATGSVTGTDQTGGLSGQNNGTISLSYATGTVSASGRTQGIGGLVGNNDGTVTQSYATGEVTTAGNQVDAIGGLVGLNLLTVMQSYATGAVDGSLSGSSVDLIGGLVGFNDTSSSVVIQSYATGSVTVGPANFGVAGLVGGNYGTIIQSYATGAVTSNPGFKIYLGGLTALNGGGSGTATNSYWDEQTTGLTDSASGTGLTTAQFKSGLPSGFDSTVWGINASINNGYPHLLWQFPSSIPGGSSTPPSLPPGTLASVANILGLGDTTTVAFNSQVEGSTSATSTRPFTLADKILDDALFATILPIAALVCEGGACEAVAVADVASRVLTQLQLAQIAVDAINDPKKAKDDLITFFVEQGVGEVVGLPLAR